jgi:pyruvate dehydrogenase E2 component (dihydrolipoamide acetyltransferase)
MPEVVMPRLSDTMEEGTLSRWLKEVGDPVRKGDVLAEIETDKATMDLEAFDDGVLESQLAEVGTSVPIGQPVAVIGDGSATVELASAAPEPSAPEPSAPEPSAPEPSAPEPSAPETPDPLSEARKTIAPPTGAPTGETAQLRTSPLARRLAHDNQLDLAAIAGSGPRGRITRRDVEDAIVERQARGTVAKDSAPAAALLPSTAAEPPVAEDGDEVVPVGAIRRVAARRLSESQAVPHFFMTALVNVERLIALRAEINAGLAESGVKVSLNDLVVRACAVALRAHPEVNASWGGDTLLLHRHVNIGIAVSTPAGLVVPVIRDADRKPLSTIAAETREFAGRARDGDLKVDEMTGGTFTVSNLGMFGIDQFTAVINPPEVAILAVGAATDVPVVRDGLLVAVPVVKITLTVDHRVLDGAMAAAFLRDLTAILEQPLRIVV